MKAMLLAAGRGERMGHLTATRPKPLLCIGSETLIERHLRRLADAGVDEIVINLSYRGDLLREAVGRTSRWGQSVHYSEEGEPPLETAGGIVRALPLLGDAPFLVVSSDIVTTFDLGSLDPGDHEGCLMLVPNPPHHPEGDFGLAASGILTEEPPLLTFGGVAVLRPSLFEGLDAGVRPLRPVLDEAIARNALCGIRFDGLWLDVGTPQRLSEARLALENDQ